MSDQDLEELKNLFDDLGLSDPRSARAERDLSAELGSFLQLEPGALRKVAWDLSQVAGASGDWTLALEFCQRLVAAGDDRPVLKLWQLRSLVELERFGEALALSSAVRWSAEQMIHVNYLTGWAFEKLGMREQARLRFDAVRKVDARYRNIAEKT